jgi:hypothetical protein
LPDLGLAEYTRYYFVIEPEESTCTPFLNIFLEISLFNSVRKWNINIFMTRWIAMIVSD